MAYSFPKYLWSLAVLPMVLLMEGCPGCDEGPRVTVRVQDAQGNVVPFQLPTAAHVTKGQVSCSSVGDDLMEDGTCELRDKGAHTFAVTIDGEPLAQEFTPRWKDEGCYFATDQLTLTLPGAGCPKPSGDAIVGKLIDASGREATGKVSVAAETDVPCTLEGSSFRCPAQRAYTARYYLKYELGFTRFNQPIVVPVDDCQIGVLDATLDLRKRMCAEAAKTSLAGSLQVRKERVATVSVTLKGGPSSPCEVKAPRTQDGVVYHDYSCPALTPTGGGEYVLEINDTVQTRTYEHTVLDDGCRAVSGYFASYDLTRRDPALDP